MPRLTLGVLLRFVLIGLSLVMLAGQSLASAQAAHPAFTPNGRHVAVTGNTYTVNSTADTPDADVGIPACADASGFCTLRAAIDQANFTVGADTLVLPASVYLLTRVGVDDMNVLGDLDITDDLTIQGAGSGVTIVDGNGAVTGDRVFQIFASAKATTISGLTIRNGVRNATFDEGGGLNWAGGGSHLTFSDVVFEGNSGYYGGGLYLNYSASSDVVALDHVAVHGNTAPTAAAGGLGASFGDFAQFSMTNSQVYNNSAYEGGGVYFQNGAVSFDLSSVRIENSAIYSNTASLSAGFENHSGSTTVPVVMLNDHLYNNQASIDGGAIGNYGALSISTSTLDTNSAGMRGGGLYDYEGGLLDLTQTTLSGNSSQSGGGIYTELFIHNASQLALTNTTLSGNTASQDGAGIYAQGGTIKVFNSTLANNQVLVPNGTVYAGMGGGVYVVAPAIIEGQNMLLAKNTHRYGTVSPVPDDCFGPINSLGNNLIQEFSSCIISGNLTGNITGIDPLLSPLMFHGSTTLTQAPLPGSPAIDAGLTPCTDTGGASLLTDQRGFRRPIGANCDIGAVEFSPYTAYLPLAKK